MSIIKVVRHENPFAQIDKRILENKMLSWRAKGLLSYLLSRPPNWTVKTSDLVQRSKDGRDAVYSIMQELIKAGYIRRQGYERNNEGKYASVNYLVYEEPYSKN